MAKKAETITEPKPGLVTVRGLRNEDTAVIVNGEVRVIPRGKEITVEKRFADEFERAERAKDIVALNSEAMISKEP